MDPLSIAAGATGLATLCFQCSKAMYQLYDSTQMVDVNITSFCDEVDTLARVLGDLSNSFDHPRILAVVESARQEYDGRLWANVDTLISKCRRSMESLNVILQKINKDSGSVFNKPIKQFRLRFRTDDIIRLRGQIQSHKLMMQITLQSISIWLHIESNTTGQDHFTILNQKLDTIKGQIATIQDENSLNPQIHLENVPKPSDPTLQLAKPSSNETGESDQTTLGASDEADPSSVVNKVKIEQEDFRQTLKDCVQSAEEFVSSTRTVIESRASAAGSVKGFGLASQAGEPLTTERRQGIERWIVAPTILEELATDNVDLAFREPSNLSNAERQFVEISEQIEQLGKDGQKEEAAEIGMTYLHDLWDQYGPRLLEFYTSNSYQDLYMKDEKHGLQLRRNILDSEGRGFVGPPKPRNGIFTVLHFFAHIGCSAEFRLLLIRSTLDPNARDHVRKTPLIRAAHMGHRPIVEQLLSIPGISVETIDNDGRSALDNATIHNHTDIVELFLKHLDIDPVKDKHYLMRPFQLAAEYGRLSVIKLFLSLARVDINSWCENKETVLHTAIVCNQFSIVQHLLKQKQIDVERADGDERSALVCAAWYHRVVILTELLNCPGINVDHRSANGRTALSYCASHGFSESVRQLLESGANPNMSDNFGISPMMYAASRTYRDFDDKIWYPEGKKEFEAHAELLQRFLDHYKIPKQRSERLAQYIDLCTKQVDRIRMDKNFLSRLDLSARWFTISTSEENSKPRHDVASGFTQRTTAKFFRRKELQDELLNLKSTKESIRGDPVEQARISDQMNETAHRLEMLVLYEPEYLQSETQETGVGRLKNQSELKASGMQNDREDGFSVLGKGKAGTSLSEKPAAQDTPTQSATRTTDASELEVEREKGGLIPIEPEKGDLGKRGILPYSWRVLVDRGTKTKLHFLPQDLVVLKEAIDVHVSKLLKHDVINAAQIKRVKFEYEKRVRAYLENEWRASISVTVDGQHNIPEQNPLTSTHSDNPNIFKFSSPEAIIAKAMLRHSLNAIFVVGFSHSGKSKFIWYTCGNVGRRMRALEKIREGAQDGLEFIITGGWLGGLYYPVIEVRCKAYKNFSSQALHAFAERHKIDVRKIICLTEKLNHVVSEHPDPEDVARRTHLVRHIHDFSLEHMRSTMVHPVQLDNPTPPSAGRKIVEGIHSLETAFNLHEQRSLDEDDLPLVNVCSNSEDAIRIVTQNVDYDFGLSQARSSESDSASSGPDAEIAKRTLTLG